ncbi:FecR domain-containing protein [Leptospira sp. 96542]|nr:FecR domain-containing protein [Leptospira sp. 96542]
MKVHLRLLLLLTLLSPNFLIPDPSKEGIYITVEKGQTLSIISKTYLDDPKKWRELLKSNQIDNPNLIQPGKQLFIPKSLGKKPMADVYQFQGGPEVLKISQKETSWMEVQLGLGLYAKDEVRTNQNSQVQFTLNTGSKFEISENSHVVMEKTKTEKEPEEVFLRKGRLRAIINKNYGANKRMFILRTDSAVSEVKGTEFLTEVDSKGNTTLGCYEGIVSVTAEKQTVDVNAGFATYVEKGKPPTPPFAIPNPPDVKSE